MERAVVNDAKLTVIIPVRDRPDDLKRALASLEDQGALPHAVVVVDDGSIPPVTISEDLRDRLRLKIVRHPVARGAAAARNTGMTCADTDWITFLDSDDALIAGTLERRWQLAMRDRRDGGPTDRDVFACGWIDVDEEGKELGCRFPRPADTPLEFASGCWYSPGSCIILNHAAALAVGLQDETLQRLEDYDWFLSLSLSGFVLRCQPVLGARITRARRQKPEVIKRTAQQIRTKWLDRLPQPIRRALTAYLELEIAAALFFSGRKLRAATHLIRSYAIRPRRRLHLSPGWEKQPAPGSKGGDLLP